MDEDEVPCDESGDYVWPAEFDFEPVDGSDNRIMH